MNRFAGSVMLGLLAFSFTTTHYAQLGGWPRKVVPSEPLLGPRVRYRLIEKFGPVKFCDPDCFGPCNVTRERRNAEDVFPLIRKDAEAFAAIAEHLGLAGASQFTSEQKLSVYREYKKLAYGLSLEPEGKNLRFKMPEANGSRVEGVVSPEGEIALEKKEPGHIMCPL